MRSRSSKKAANGNVIFLGTPQICVPFLEDLIQHFNLQLIITQPDTVGGRNQKPITPPVKTFAQNQGIEVIQPPTLKNEGLVEKIKGIKPIIAIVIAYGQYIPSFIFRIPRFKTINLHFSLLPLYRGAAPVQRAIENGETETGLTIFEITKKMDAGNIWAQKKVKISPDDTSVSLQEKLTHTGIPFLVETVKDIIQQKIQSTPQDHTKATYARAIQKQEGRVDWNLEAFQIANKLRSFTPWPGIFFTLNDRNIKIRSAQIHQSPHPGQPGELLKVEKTGMFVVCGNQSVLKILEILPEGKKPMTPYQYSLGNPLPAHLH